MRRRVFASQVVGVARGDQRQAHPPGDVNRAGSAFVLDPHPVILDLDIKVLFAKDLLIPRAKPFGFGRLAVQDKVGKLGRGAA